MEVKKIFDKYERFEEIEEDLKALLKKGNQFNTAVFIIRKLCVVISSAKSPYSKAQAESLKNICKLSSETIIRDKVGDALDADEKLTAAMYHIARVISEAGDCESFTETICCFVAVLKCMPVSSDTKHFNTLTQFTVLIHNSCNKFLDHISVGELDNLESKLFNFWEILLQFVSNLSKQNLYLVFQLAKNIVISYGRKLEHGKQSLQNRIILRLKQFFKSEQNQSLDQNSGKLLQLSLNASLTFFQTFSTVKDYESAVRVLREMIEILKTVFPQSSRENQLVLAYDRVLTPFLFSFKNIPLKEISHSEICESVQLLEKALAESSQDSKAEWAPFHISLVLISLNQYWATDIEKAKSVFPLSVIPALDDMISKLGKILKNNQFPGACVNASGQQCALQTGVQTAYNLEHTLVSLIMRTFSWDAETQLLLIKTCENSLRRSEKFLQIAIEEKCWRSTEMTFYLCENMCAAASRIQKNYIVSKNLLKKSWELYLTVRNNSEEGFLSRKSVAKTILANLAAVLRKLGENSSACNVVAVAVALERSPLDQDQSFYLKQWSEAVAALPDEDISLLTLLRSNNELNDLVPDFNPNTLNWAELFVWEMIALGSYGDHKSSVLLKSWKTRKGLNLSALQKIKSAAYFLRALAFCVDLTDVKKFISDFKAEEYHDLLKTISSRDRPVALCDLAELSYFLFFVTKKLHQALSKENVENAKTFEPLPKLVLSATDVVCKHDACDMTPTFPNLTTSKEASLLTLLDSAVTYWNEALYKGLEVSQLTSREQENCAQYLAEAAMYYRLCGHYVKEKKAWEICRSFGERIQNDKLMLRAISGLMDLGCCDVGWVQRGQAIAATLENEPTAKDVLHLFKHSNILQCFLNEREDEAVLLLKDILQATDTWSWYYIRTKFLLGRYLADAPRAKRKPLFPEQGGNPISIMRYCYQMTKHLINLMKPMFSGSSYGGNRYSVIDHYALLDLHFSVCLGLGYTYMEMMLPREARVFLKYALLQPQKMGLSVRTAECLALLGKVDLLVLKTEDVTVKIEGIKHILEVNSLDKEELAVEVPVYQDEDDGSRLRIPPRDGNQLGASPTLPIESFPIPEFLSHKFSCSCYYCCHVLLHTMWLDMFYMQASVCTTQFQVKNSSNFFCNGLKLAEKCRFKHEKLLNGFAERAYLLEDFHRTETTLRFKYADLLSLYSKDIEAWNVNKHVFASINRTQLKDNLLLTEVKEQKISLIDIANPQAFSLEPETQMQREASSKSGTSRTDVTPNVALLKRQSALSLKTPVPSQRQKDGPRTPLKTITPQSVAPIKGKVFVQPRGVVPPLLIFSNSDDESPPAAPKSVSKLKAVKKPTTTARKNKEIDAKSARAKVNALELSGEEDSIMGSTDSEDDIRIVLQRFPAPSNKHIRISKKIPQKAGKEVSDSEGELKIVFQETQATGSKVRVRPKVDIPVSKFRAVKSATAVSYKTSSSSIPVKSTRSRKLL